MKPKNKFQQHIMDLSKTLPKITEPQQRWAHKQCFDHIGKRNAKGTITCLECGHSWQEDNSPLTDAILGCKCPNCSTKLQLDTTQQRVFKETEYFGMITTCDGCQVIRLFYMNVYRKAGLPAKYTCTEVVQRWIAPNGKTATVARIRRMSMMYYDLWNESTALEIRPYHRSHDISPAKVYPRQKFIPELIRNGFNGNYYKIDPFVLFSAILSDSKAETLLKAGQYSLLSYFIRYNTKSIDAFWNSIRIAIRNDYTIEDGSVWCDYIDQLNFFGEDTNSPKYVCPDNLHRQHDLYMKKLRAYNERQELEKKRQKARENEGKFKELKAKFFGIAFTDGTIQVRVLESVDEFMEEGKAMHHCVFDGSYFLRAESLVLSATIDGKRIETVEISLKTLQVLQSRGVCNQPTEFHNQIVKLVKQNIPLIARRIAA